MSMRVFCYLLIIFFILQLHAKLSNANFNSQAPQAANNEGLGESTITQVSKKVTQDVKTRKVLKHVNVNIEANDQKNGLEIESKETVRKRKNKQRLTRTVSLTADYSNPGHHPPRHN